MYSQSGNVHYIDILRCKQDISTCSTGSNGRYEYIQDRERKRIDMAA